MSLRDWSDLTTVCLVNIFQRLSLSDRWLIVMRVCKSWMYAAQDITLHTSLDLEPAFGSPDTGRPDDVVLMATYDNHIWTKPWNDKYDAWLTPGAASAWLTPDRVDGIMKSVAEWSDGGLKEVRVRHCSDEALCFLADRCPNLQILFVKSSQRVTDKSMSKIAYSCPDLIELDISYCKKVTYKSIELIGIKCPNLKIFKRNLWNAAPQDGDIEAKSIARFMPNLKHLELQFSSMSVTGLKVIAESCNDLEFLDLYGCPHWRSREFEQTAANLKNIKTIIKHPYGLSRSLGCACLVGLLDTL